MRYEAMAAACMFAIPGSVAFSQTTVTFGLASPQSGTSVLPGETIAWSVSCQVGTDSVGLAGFAVDLVQSDTNPAYLDIPPASAVPTLLLGFSRPAGISNPSPGGNAPGYCGTPIGASGASNLVEIGGMQNCFGIAGTTLGTDTSVDGGLGQGASPLLLAQGEFAAPAQPGTYCFSLARGMASVLLSIGTGGSPSPVAPGEVELPASLCFTVVPTCDPDYTQDGNADQSDIACLIDIVAGSPGCSALDPDFNHDGNVDQSDVADLIDVVAGGACP